MPIYLDNHATTRCDERVVAAMTPYFSDIYGNAASRGHSFGIRANAGVERARTQLAELLGATAKEIIFTSGATEANNLALLGAVRAHGGGHIVTSAIEHRAVLDPVDLLRQQGAAVSTVGVDASGVIDSRAVIDAIRDDTVLVSVMWANNEVGTLADIATIGAACRERGVLFHTDAAQAVGKVPIDVVAAKVDLLSLSAHKLYGPKGIGAVYIRRGRPLISLEPLMVGGGQERGYRSGTLAVPLIVGLGAAAQLCREELAGDGLSALTRRRDALLDGLLDLDGVHLNGDRTARLPNNLNLYIEGIDAKALMMGMRDIAMSSGSACSSESLRPSHVLSAMGLEKTRIHRSIRLGVGRFTTDDEVQTTLARFTETLPKLRALSAAIPPDAP